MEARAKLAALGVTEGIDSRVEKARAEEKIANPEVERNREGKRRLLRAGRSRRQSAGEVRQRRPVDRGLADVVKADNLGIVFPDPSSVRALRRGTVTCGATPPPKAKASAKKAVKNKEARVQRRRLVPPKPELLPGPCTVELIPSDNVRTVD